MSNDHATDPNERNETVSEENTQDTELENSQTDDEALENALNNLPNEAQSEDHCENKTPSLEDELAKTKDQLLRALADAENTRKRAQLEKEDTATYAVSSFARDLLSVADNLSRAIESIKSQDNEDLKPLVEGVEITEKELLKAFAKHKIERIEALDQPFDHNLHQAMVEIPSEDHDEGIVIQEMQIGYKIGDRLLRPSMVGVSKKA